MRAASVSVQLKNGRMAHGASREINPILFYCILLMLVGGAILRSAIATRRDSFTVDESYHITAGVSYVQRADFRLNPEHPPLVKLWVGSLLTATGFKLRPLRVFHDKVDERNFTAEEVYINNDFDSVQRRARIAMWSLNGVFLIALGLALRRAFAEIVALGTILFLAVDPTVAFRYWQWRDLVYCSLALGLALGAKHSAPVFEKTRRRFIHFVSWSRFRSE